jgi:hypothetical protein
MNVRAIVSIFAVTTTSFFAFGGCAAEQATQADQAAATSEAEAIKSNKKKCGTHVCSKDEVCNPGASCPVQTGPDKHPCDPILPYCEAKPTGCAVVKCKSGTHCEEVAVQCIKAPCPPIAECVPDAPPPSPCATVKCAAGTHCEETPVECLVAPCPVVASCVPTCDTTDPTRHFVGHSPQQCQLVKFACQTNQVAFFDACGCGCQDTCPTSKCGPALGMPNHLCADGSYSGPTGTCLKHANGTCGWEVRSCPLGRERLRFAMAVDVIANRPTLRGRGRRRGEEGALGAAAGVS